MTSDELRHALRRLKLSPTDAARKLHVQHTTVYRWLNGDRRIPGPAATAVRGWLELAAAKALNR
jgi:DNA-binding transcriptional regulator YiaG